MRSRLFFKLAGILAATRMLCATIALGQGFAPGAIGNVTPQPASTPDVQFVSGISSGYWTTPCGNVTPANGQLATIDSGGVYTPSVFHPSPDFAATDNGALRGDLWSHCADSDPRGYYVFVDYDAFRGISDGDWENNGINVGANFGTRLGAFSDWTGIGFQIGGSAAVSDWSGAGWRMDRTGASEVQGFVTYGFFRKPEEHGHWSAAVVQDWMFTSTFGLFAQDLTFDQWRAQIGFALGERNEVGLWGAVRGDTETRIVPSVGVTNWRPINQLNAYWHYKWFQSGADSWIWVGVPEHDRVAGSGSLGDYIAGALVTAPLADRMGAYATVSYMHPSASPGGNGAIEDSWNFTIGLAFYPARNAHSDSLNGQRWMPAMRVANNGTFLIDTDNTY